MEKSKATGAEQLNPSGEVFRSVAKVHRADVERARERNRQARLRWVFYVGLVVFLYLLRRAFDENPLALG